MIAIPAIDLRGGACVQLVGGAYDQERVRVQDPVKQAAAFRDAGFARLHVVDLDAATGRGHNRQIVRAILALGDIEVQVGGGVRSDADVAELLALGASAVVIGTRALEAPEFLRGVAARHPKRIIVALDVRGREVLTRGWSEGTGRSIHDLVTELAPIDLAAVLVTAVHVEGTLGGVDSALYRELAPTTSHAIHASGGVGTEADLATLRAIGVRAAIVGMALYTAALDMPTIAARYGRPSRAGSDR